MLFEELGRALYPGPYFATVALALPALPAGLRAASSRASGAGRRAVERRSSPTSTRRPACSSARRRPSRPRASRWTRSTRRARSDGSRGGGRAATATSRRRAPRAFAALALEAVGIAQRALELGDRVREDARAVRQADRRLPGRLAPARRHVTSRPSSPARSRTGPPGAWPRRTSEAPVAAAAAKAYAADAAVAACERSIQVHGGIGFTWEHVAPPLLQAGAVDPGVRRLPGGAARGGRRGNSWLSAPSLSRARPPGSAPRVRSDLRDGGWRVFAGVRAEACGAPGDDGAAPRRHRRRLDRTRSGRPRRSARRPRQQRGHRRSPGLSSTCRSRCSVTSSR